MFGRVNFWKKKAYENLLHQNSVTEFISSLKIDGNNVRSAKLGSVEIF